MSYPPESWYDCVDQALLRDDSIAQSSGDPENVHKCAVHGVPLQFNGFAMQCPHRNCSWIRMVKENRAGSPQWLK